MDSEKGTGMHPDSLLSGFGALTGRSSTRGFEAQNHLPHASRRFASPLWWCDHRANLQLEVESLIELAVSELVAEQPSLEPHRQDLTDKLVQALETDASWVELYGVTGELAVPGITPSEDEFGAGLRQVMEVRALVAALGAWNII